jgi:dTMP kinase
MVKRLFVSFEGGEGSGKSTQATGLRDKLLKEGILASLVHEPGSTPLGWHLREYLKSNQPLCKEAELLLFEAARAELVTSKIRSALNNGYVVIADRFEASSIAYQGYGRMIDLEIINDLNEFATQGLKPDVTFLLDLEPAEGLRRLNPQLRLDLELNGGGEVGRQERQDQRKFEEEPLKFHERVRRGYLALARDGPGRWVTIDASRSEAAIGQEIWRHVSRRLEISRKY